MYDLAIAFCAAFGKQRRSYVRRARKGARIYREMKSLLEAGL